ncbi:hypothetical protein [Pseudomonas sp. BC115LW]|uniref:hypothetical protein n=1 Tax=Pseudomonas sp. BC115LW TaxID=2683267 RepID=UPI00141266ED|nr:hypothetical protein [Pseudomonas sp. BC115LW]NBB33108.1 hypothetical protein [Pseudomonas sp. BC115LW]
MNNHQKANKIIAAALELEIATRANTPDKLTLKLDLRDIIIEALAGTQAEPVAKRICDKYVPFCDAFDALPLLEEAEEWKIATDLPLKIAAIAFTHDLNV